MKMFRKQLSVKRSKGFTLLEMLLVGVIIAVIGGIAARQYGTVSASNKANEAVLSVRSVHAAVSAYNQDKAAFPTNVAALVSEGYLSDNATRTPWGGTITLGTPADGLYTIEVTTIPSPALCNMIAGRLTVTVNTKAGEKVEAKPSSGSCTSVTATYPVE